MLIRWTCARCVELFHLAGRRELANKATGCTYQCTVFVTWALDMAQFEHIKLWRLHTPWSCAMMRVAGMTTMAQDSPDCKP